MSFVYFRFWHEALLPIRAQLNDLQLLEELSKYPNMRVTKVASTEFGRHTWYVSEILAGLSLFDDRIVVDVKTLMVTNLCLPQSINYVKCLNYPPEPLSSLALASSVTERNTVIVGILNLNGKDKALGSLIKDHNE